MSDVLAQGRQADSARRRQRVIKALNTATTSGTEISISAIARTARVDRTFLYRHRDLLAQIHTAQTRPTVPSGTGVSHASLHADLVNANERATRQTARIRLLETKLSELLGDQAWRDSGLGAPADIDHLKRRITQLEQQVIDLTNDLTERDQDLEAARGANRDLINQLNRK
jgi:hypothetical protein